MTVSARARPAKQTPTKLAPAQPQPTPATKSKRARKTKPAQSESNANDREEKINDEDGEDDGVDVVKLVRAAAQHFTALATANTGADVDSHGSDDNTAALHQLLKPSRSITRTNQSASVSALASFGLAPKSAPLFERAKDGTFHITAHTQQSLLPSIQTTATTSLAAQTKPATTKKSTSGPQWFDMPAPVLTPELKRDLKLMNLRAYTDPKRFYKRSERKPNEFPKFFHTGTVIAGAHEYYSARPTDSSELSGRLADSIKAQGQDYLKRKYAEIQSERKRKPYKDNNSKNKRFKKRR